MNQKLFFTLFPKGNWILVGVGIILLLISRDTEPLANFFINFGLFLLAFKAAVIVHEAGHLIAAKLVGGVPRRVVLGKGHELYRTYVQGVRVIVNSKFIGGLAYASFDRLEFLKIRYAFYFMGGVLLNVLVSLTFYTLFGFDFYNAENQLSIDLPETIILANALMVLNFLPYYTTVAGIRVATDGLALLKLPFKKDRELKKFTALDSLFDGHEFLENKEYQRAWDSFSDYLSKDTDNKIFPLNLAVIQLKLGRLEEGLAQGIRLLDSINDKEVKPYAGWIYNFLAWIYLVLDEIEKADHYSALAMKAMPNHVSIQGTRGSVLIEKGMINEGMNLLFHGMDFKFVNNTTLSSSIYLMLAYHLKGDLKMRDKYLDFINVNASKLDVDEKILFERNLRKTEA